MAAVFRNGLLLVVLQAAVVLCGGMGMTMTLERAFPTNHGGEMSKLRARDWFRHGRILQQSYSPPVGIVDFPVEGTYDPFLVGYNSFFLFDSFLHVTYILLNFIYVLPYLVVKIHL